MNATISTTNYGNETCISIRRARSFKLITVSTADLNKTLRNIIVNLSNMGYDVTVNDD